MLRSILIISLIMVSFQAQALKVGTTPSIEKTPGSFCEDNDADFVDYRYEEQIAWCARNVDSGLKKKIYALYKIPEECQPNYTIDHFIPLALGGNNAVTNLWPEHKKVKATRKSLEQILYNQIDRSEITQADAVDTIVRAKKYPSKEAHGIVDPCDK